MSSEVTLIIIGAVLVLLPILDIISSMNLFSAKIRVPFIILGIILIIYGGYAYGAVNLQGQIELAQAGNKVEISYPIERVQVISPVQNDSVKCRILTMGVYPEGHEKDIWVLLKPTDDKYYPQSDHTNTSYKSKGEWQVITRFGGDQAERYEIIVYETNEAASQFFSKTIEDWKAIESYPGLLETELPAGATEVDRMEVYLLDNCRGEF